MARVTITREEAEDGLLPRVCALTGVRTDDVKTRTFLWQPAWVAVLIFAGWLPYIIVSIFIRKHMRVDLPLVREKHGHWLWRQVVGLLALFAGVTVLIGSGALAEDPATKPYILWVMLVGLVLFIAAIVLSAVLNHLAIRPAVITDDHITLVNVHQNFVDAMEEDREAEEERYERERSSKRDRRRERDRYDDEDDYEDDRPRKRRRYDDRD